MSDRFTAEKLAWLDQVTADVSLSHIGARLCTLLALRFLNRETGTAWPSQSILTEMLGISETTLKRVVKELRERRHIEVIVSSGRGRANEYRPLMHSLKGSTDEPISRDKRGHQRPPSNEQKGPFLTDKRVHQRPLNPMKEPFEKSAAVSPQCEIESSAIFTLIPSASASWSNRARVRQAVSLLEAEGIDPKALRIAVAAFVADSPNAKDRNGRFMGPAHSWLTEKRGWEAYMPNSDTVFLADKPQSAKEWMWRVRSWQLYPRLWKTDVHGPAPDAPNSRVQKDVLAYCLANPPATVQPANDLRPAGSRRASLAAREISNAR